MPQVPTYQGPQVSSQPLRPAYQSDVDVSSGTKALAQGLGQVAEAADRIGERDALVKAETVDTEISTGWLEWSAKNQRNYQGEKAKDYAVDAEAWWASAKETYGKDLDPRAKAIIARTLGRKRVAAMGNVAQFVSGEQERHADDVNAASVASAVQFGVSTGDVAGSAEQLRSMAAAKGARKGWTTEQVQAEQLKNLSGLHLAQISKLAEKNPEAAQEYYTANKLEIAAAAQPRVEEVIKGETDNKFATQFAAQHADKPLAEQLKAAGGIEDPTRREKTLNQIRNNSALVRQAQAEVEAKHSDEAWQLFSQGKKVPEQVLAGMNGRERAQLQESMRSRSERAAAGRPVKTDMATYIDLREKLAAGEKINLAAYTEKIAPAQMEQLLDIKTATSKGGVKQDSMKTDEQRVSSALAGMGIDKSKDPKTAGAFIDEVDRRVRAESAARGGKELIADEKQKIVDSVALDKVFVDEWGTDPQKPLFALTPEQLGKAYVKVPGSSGMYGTQGTRDVPLSSVPMSDRAEIIRARRARGLPTTEQAIVETYLKANKKPEGTK